MCLMNRILSSGERVQEQCPKVAITSDSWLNQFKRIGQQYPEMTLAECARRMKRNVEWIVRQIFRESDTPDWVPKPGDLFEAGNGEILEVKWADIFAIHWTTNEFSSYSDLQGMKK